MESKNYTFGSLIGAMVTPFEPGGDVDYAAAARLAVKLVDDGCDGLLVTGTTGETPTLSDEENLRMFRTVVEAVDGRVSILAGSTTNDTRHSVQLSQRAKEAGVDGILLTTPYYNKPSQKGIVAHVREVASAVGLPIMLYDIPGRTGTALLPETIVELAQIPEVIALKDAKADFQSLTTVLASTDLDVYSGDDSLVLPWMAAGAVGLVSVTAHVAAAKYRELIDQMHKGNLDQARRIHFELDPLQRGIMGHIQGAVATKYALMWEGVLENATVRLPLVAPSEQELAEIREDLVLGGLSL